MIKVGDVLVLDNPVIKANNSFDPWYYLVVDLNVQKNMIMIVKLYSSFEAADAGVRIENLNNILYDLSLKEDHDYGIVWSLL